MEQRLKLFFKILNLKICWILKIDPLLQRVFAIQDTLLNNAILFIGINPAFGEGGENDSFYYELDKNGKNVLDKDGKNHS